MNTEFFEPYQNIKVHFHVGRGGRFYNGGCKTFVGIVDSLADCFGDATLFSEDEDGEPLPDNEWTLVDSGGNVKLTGRENIERETGIIDWDGEYDTDIVRYISACDDDEYQLIIDAAERGEYVDEDVLAYACSALDKLLATTIKAYPSNMEVFTQEGCVHLERDTFAVYTEDEESDVRALLEDEGFISQSIDEIIAKMDLCQWFSEENEDEETM